MLSIDITCVRHKANQYGGGLYIIMAKMCFGSAFVQIQIITCTREYLRVRTITTRIWGITCWPPTAVVRLTFPPNVGTYIQFEIARTGRVGNYNISLFTEV